MPRKRRLPDSDNEPRKRHASEADVRPKATPSTPKAPGPRRATTPGLTDGVQELKLSPAQEAFRQRVDEAAKGTPRFLFRFWSHRSGGDEALNTVDGIIPLAFLGHKGPVKSFYKTDPGELRSLARSHLGWHYHFNTVYSSWSQSLAFVLDWARSSAADQSGIYISILDTAQVDESNVILHTEALNTVFGSIPYIALEYLVYGPITGPAFRAIPLKYFLSSPSPHGLPITGGHALKHILGQGDDKAKISRILRLARMYGGGLELPIAAHMMAFVVGKGQDQKVRQLYLTEISKSLPIPADWISDPTIVNPDAKYHGVPEAHRAAMFLSDMVRLKLGGRESASSTGVTKHSQGPTSADIQKTADSVINSPRVPEQTKRTYPRMVTDLFIASKGYEMSNQQIEGFKKENS